MKDHTQVFLSLSYDKDKTQRERYRCWKKNMFNLLCAVIWFLMEKEYSAKEQFCLDLIDIQESENVALDVY